MIEPPPETTRIRFVDIGCVCMAPPIVVCALRLQEARFIKSTPQRLIAEGTDWRPRREIKRELKA